MPVPRLPAFLAPAPVVLMLLASTFQAAPARAIGLEGPFKLDNWELLFSSNTAQLPRGNGEYQCLAFGNTSCVDGPDTLQESQIQIAPTGGFTVVGARSSDFALAGQLVTVDWTLDPLASDRTSDYRITFNFLFESTDVGEEIKGYFAINDVLTSVQTSTSGQSALGSFVITPTDKIAFGVSNSNLANTFGYVNIVNFNAEPVPAPLPLLGAGAAFAWSRRLRGRVRLEAGKASR